MNDFDGLIEAPCRHAGAKLLCLENRDEKVYEQGGLVYLI
jgi:hypothetical protein